MSLANFFNGNRAAKADTEDGLQTLVSWISQFTRTVSVYKLNHMAIDSITAVAAEARVNFAFPATAGVGIMAMWSKL